MDIDVPRFITRDMLREIRENSDWREVYIALGIEKDEKRSNDREWWGRSPFTDENTPSFHMNDRGWYCHSSAPETHGGGVIELVQAVISRRTGRALNCFDAGRWLLEQGLSHVSSAGQPGRGTSDLPDGAGRDGAENRPRSEGKKKLGGERSIGDDEKKENQPIRQTLVPMLDMEHPEIGRRGISRETAEYLGFGYLPETSKSPLAGRMVFQVRGIQEDEGILRPVILTHMGRAMTDEQEEEDGKWKLYGGFHKTLEIYNIDQVLLDDRALEQIRSSGNVLVVEGCFDVAKLVEADIRNVVATFGSSLSEQQAEKLNLISEMTGTERFLFWYDRDAAGRRGHEKAQELLQGNRWFEVEVFQWGMTFPSPVRGNVKIPEEIGDVCEFSVEQLRWMRREGVI